MNEFSSRWNKPKCRGWFSCKSNLCGTKTLFSATSSSMQLLVGIVDCTLQWSLQIEFSDEEFTGSRRFAPAAPSINGGNSAKGSIHFVSFRLKISLSTDFLLKWDVLGTFDRNICVWTKQLSRAALSLASCPENVGHVCVCEASIGVHNGRTHSRNVCGF